MPIITFWSDGKHETGKTVSMAAIGTALSIENNYKTLLFNANYNDTTLEDCFWEEQKDAKVNIAKNSKMVDISEGITGISKAIASNKASPEIIPNYTKTIFKNRLEVLTDKNVLAEDYDRQKPLFKEIIKMASRYYDLVFVDLNGELDDPVVKSILECSSIVIVTTSQKLQQIKEYTKIKKEGNQIQNKNIILLLGRYDKNSKYTSKNIGRYIGENTVFAVPYNTLFFEACNEGKVVDYFIRYRKSNATERNSLFVKSVQEVAEGIIYKLKEVQMKAY
ncbi:MAG: hypothetical protein IJN50_06210 [Clostridia bacterium]|nr:hypothetical protein [Clostridia bacterium]